MNQDSSGNHSKFRLNFSYHSVINLAEVPLGVQFGLSDSRPFPNGLAKLIARYL